MDNLVELIDEYRNKRKETLDWPNWNLLDDILDDVIKIVEEWFRWNN